MPNLVGCECRLRFTHSNFGEIAKFSVDKMFKKSKREKPLTLIVPFTNKKKKLYKLDVDLSVCITAICYVGPI